jgi:hypothetical protein
MDNETERPVNYGNPYDDDELRLILNCARTRTDAYYWARFFGRSQDAIELIYHRCTMSDKAVADAGMEDNASLQQIRRIAKELGLINTWYSKPR